MAEEMAEYSTDRTRVTLSDVAYDVSDRIENPSKSGYERFVGLEHFDSGELTINRWGSTEDVTSAMKVFKKGDVLFARRNAYLKRASVVEFDGMCSGDAYVLRQKPDAMAKNLLPLILNSEDLWDYAIAHAAGSMSKRVKWRDLAKYEFPLPPLDEQRRMADLLWALEGAIRKIKNTQDVFKKSKSTVFHKLSKEGIESTEFMDSPIGKTPRPWKVVKLKDCIIKRDEFSQPPHKEKKYVGLEHIESGSLKLTNFANSENVKSNCAIFYPGDLLYSKLRPYLDKVVIADFKGIASTEILVLKSNELTTNDYMKHLFHSKRFILHNTHHSYGTKMPRTSMKIIGKYKIPLPPLPEQQKIAEILSKLDRNIEGFEVHKLRLENLKKRLLNDLLTGKRRLGGV